MIVDCASVDGSAQLAQRLAPPQLGAEVLALERNLGFAGGTNLGFERSSSPWVLTLNPDARPAPNYLGRLLERAEDARLGRVGALTGRISRLDEPARLDACGMRLTRSWRHLDRGSNEPDRDQYASAERVFGATGAASLWRREALADVAFASGPFDVAFHSFREDAELCFRLRERRWEVVYEPTAHALHRRRVLPQRRRSLPLELNRRSLVNRYRLRLAHQTAGNFLRTLPWTAARDLAALGYVALIERGSLSAYREIWRERRSLLERRRWVAERRTAAPGEVERWFARAGEPL